MVTNSSKSNYILGTGMSALGVALSLKLPAFEAESKPGGICYSIYIDETSVLHDLVLGDISSCFRFSPAVGHFLFSPNASTLQLLSCYASFKKLRMQIQY